MRYARAEHGLQAGVAVLLSYGADLQPGALVAELQALVAYEAELPSSLSLAFSLSLSIFIKI